MVRRELRVTGGNGVGESEGSALPDVPDAVIETAADRIADLSRRTQLAFAYEVGRLMVEQFHGGDLAERHRRGPKDASLARLVVGLKERGLATSASTLLRCIAAFEVIERLGGISTLKNLTRSHIDRVLPLPAPEQERLLREAQAKGWTVVELGAAADSRPRRERLGRPRTPAFDRALAQAERLFARDGPAFQELDRLLTFDARKQEAIHARAIRFAERVEEFRLRVSPKRLAEVGAWKEAPARSRRRRRATPLALDPRPAPEPT